MIITNVFYCYKIDGDSMDDYLKELGVGMMGRMAAKGLKPRLVISEKDGKWSVRTETTFKTTTIEFTPNIEYEETTADGREIKVTRINFINNYNGCFFLQGIVRFENDKWIQKMCDKKGKESMVTRWIDEKGQHQSVRHVFHSLYIIYIFTIAFGMWKE